MSADDPLQDLMEELGRALIRSIKTSPEIRQAARRIHQQGFALDLVLSCEPDAEIAGWLRENRDGGRAPLERGGELPTRIELTQPIVAKRRARRAPAYRLNGGDVAFLESLGIDATRAGRSRRHSRRRRDS